MNRSSPGCALILASWTVGTVSVMILSSAAPLNLGKMNWFSAAVLVVAPSLASALFLAGVICWALEGQIQSDLENIQRQNQEMIDLLKRIADRLPGPDAPPRTGIVPSPESPPGPGGGIGGPESLTR